MTLQPAPGDTGKPCGVDYELKAYVAEDVDEKPHKRNSVRLAIRKVTYAPSKQGVQPSVEVSKDFVMSPNKLHLEASLDKEVIASSISFPTSFLLSLLHSFFRYSIPSFATSSLLLSHVTQSSLQFGDLD